MRLKELREFFAVPDEALEVEFTGLTNHSKNVKPGDLFIAVPGYKTDGRLYVKEAFNRGACAALVEQEFMEPCSSPVISVANIRKIQGLVAANFYKWPTRQLRMIGVTGTNGKTTVTHLLEHILSSYGRSVGLIGTIWTSNGRSKEPSEHTTPDSIELQRLLAEMVHNKIDTVVMEVSSHALALDRVTGIDFDVAVITNVTHDHFDFHCNYHNYLQSKLLLFKGLQTRPNKQRYAVVNIDDPSSTVIAGICKVPIFYYGSAEKANIRIKKIARGGFVSSLAIKLFEEDCKIVTRLPGGFNIYNILAAITVGFKEGLSTEQIEEAVGKFPGVPGRYQEINCGQPFRVMVDFAHNPAALENILKMAKENTKGRLIIVFGCEGEKDRLKRPLMGRIAVANSEIPILTADNIHHEDLEQIFHDVLKDLPQTERRKMIIEPDRGLAIKKAIDLARPGDFLIIAGKGHEEFLIKGSEQLRFNDVEVAKTFLQHKNVIPEIKET